MFRPLRVAAFLLVAAACGKSGGSSGPAIKVAAAADLAFAFDEIGEEFTRRTGHGVTFTFGSTGQLAKQISEGAPYDVFAAANVSFVDDVVAAGACDGATKAMYATGRIVLFWPKSSSVAAPTVLADLAAPRFVKIAIANPEHAPYGKAAKQALERSGVWDKVSSRMVYGENIKQTMQYAESGNVEVAVIALSLALGATDGAYLPIDAALHDPIDQALVVCHRGADAAAGRAFAELVSSRDGRAIMKRYGFALPGEP